MVDILFKDVEMFQEFFLFNQKYIKLGRNKAEWCATGDIVQCDEDNLVEVMEPK